MSHVEAYICDFGNHIVKASGIVGIVPTEDLFDRERSYPTNYKPERCHVHYCVDCYKQQVLIPADRMVNRKRGKNSVKNESAEREYELKIKELGYSFREQVVKLWRLKKKVA